MAENTENWTKLESDSRYPRKYQFEELETKVDNFQPLQSFTYKDTVADYDALSSLTGLEVGDGYVNAEDGLVYVWNGTSFPAEGDGLDVAMKPIGEVEEGNVFAVSGGEVYKALIPHYFNNIGYVNRYTGAVDGVNSNYNHTFFLKIKDRENLIITGYSGGTDTKIALISFYDVNLNYLSRYNTPTTGNVTDHLVPESSIPEDAVYIRVSKHVAQNANISGVYLDDTLISIENKSLPNVFVFSGYINKNNGYVEEHTGYFFSVFLKLINRKSLIVSGYSGASNKTSLVSFYDKNFNWISSYNSSESGTVRNHLVPESEIPEDAVYIRVGRNSVDNIVSITSVELPIYTNEDFDKLINKNLQGSTKEIFLDDNIGYINKSTGVVDFNNGYRYSSYLTISDRSNLIVTGYSGNANNVALVSFYDDKFNFIGMYNAPTNGSVTNHLVPESEIPEDVVYIRVSKQNVQQSFVSGAFRSYGSSLSTVQNLISHNKTDFFTIQSDSIFTENGYVDKETGLITEQSTYSYSLLLSISDRNNLRVTGYSGDNNKVALISFYNENLNFIGYYNAGTGATVTNHLVPESEIPEDAVYIRATKRTTQSFLLSGVKTTYYVDDLVINIEKALQSSSKYLSRSGKPNVDKGGFLKMKNYLGNTQNINPKVLFFPNQWNGYYYWMAYTPYPGGQVQHENPCISASNDGMNFETPAGLENPLEFRPVTEERPNAYNSDTHLVYNNDTNKIECWWRTYDPTAGQPCIKRRISSNGIDWEPTEIIFDFGTGGQESHSVIYDNGIYKYWACNAGNIIYTESSDVFNFPPFTIVPIDFAGSNLHAWHMDVINTPKGLEFAVQCWEIGGGNNNNTCDLYYILYDGSTYSEPRIIVERGDLPTDDDYQGIYRASILWHPYTTSTPVTGGTYYVYYTGIALNYARRSIFLTAGRNIDRLIGVNL